METGEFYNIFHLFTYEFHIPEAYLKAKLWVKRQIDESRAWIDNENR